MSVSIFSTKYVEYQVNERKKLPATPRPTEKRENENGNSPVLRNIFTFIVSEFGIFIMATPSHSTS